MSQTEFGELGGVRKLAQIKYEKGERRPDADYLAHIAAAGVDVLYILTGERLAGPRKAEAVFILEGAAERAARGEPPIPGADKTLAALGDEQRRLDKRSPRLEAIVRYLCSLADGEFAVADQMLLDYVLCAPKDRAAINHVVAGLRAAAALHDAGKSSPAYQELLRKPATGKAKAEASTRTPAKKARA